MEKRATTPEQKRSVIEQIYAAWLAHPQLRLGQLVCNLSPEADPFNIEDFDLVDEITNFHNKVLKP